MIGQRENGDANMDTWKGEKLHGADRRLTRAQLEAADYVRPLTKRQKVANVAESLGKLYAATGGRGRGWQQCVTALANVVR